jgi:pSer/pThr/pTyr-binding forkhead associated (FHA) protein
MTELWLKFTDENGSQKRVAVTGERFTVGRHSAADLCIPDGRLSREHVRIERLGEEFLISDRGSSNGTTLNDEPLVEPVSLKNGDRLELGGLKIAVEIESDEFAVDLPEPEQPTADVSNIGTPAAPAPTIAAATQKKRGMSMMALVLIPMFAIVILLFAGLLIFVLMSRDSGGTGNGIVVQNPGDPGDDDDGPEKTPTPKTGQGTQIGPTVPGGQVEQPSGPTGSPVPVSETAVVEESGALFLRRIAENNPRAFLTTDQAVRVNGKVKQFKGSSGLADNINSARKSSEKIKSIAAEKNLKPQLLAVAAIAKLGGSRGDVSAAAESVADVLGKLRPHIGTDQADDSLLLIAAFDQGAAGETMKMRNMLQALANPDNPESTREIRSIWFLEKEGKITKAEFDRALTFLAIGAITQNPKAFGVNAEALNL